MALRMSHSLLPTTVLNTPPSAFNALMTPSNPVAGVDDLDVLYKVPMWTVTQLVLPIHGVNSIPLIKLVPLFRFQRLQWRYLDIHTLLDGTNVGTTISTSVTVGGYAPEATGGLVCSRLQILILLGHNTQDVFLKQV